MPRAFLYIRTFIKQTERFTQPIILRKIPVDVNHADTLGTVRENGAAMVNDFLAVNPQFNPDYIVWDIRLTLG